MYVGACVTMLACFALIYIITTSEDTSREWMIWVFMGITLALVIGASDTRRDTRGGMATTPTLNMRSYSSSSNHLISLWRPI
jgi:hypothetical protein